MPTSPSPRRGGKVPPRAAPARSLWPRIAVIAVLAVAGVTVSALPASWAARFLPGTVHAEDFSGTIWHGSAGRFTVNGRDAGALEWRLHPLPLLTLHISADVHWVKGSFLLDGAVDADHGDVTLSNLQGGGPIGDLRDFGMPPGWTGGAGILIQQLSGKFKAGAASLKSATGEISVSDLSAPQLADGAALGGYVLKFANAAITPDTDAAATLTDTGGPLSVDAEIHLSLKNRTGLFSGAVKERPDTPPALRNQLANIAQLHARDAQGRIPVDLEFSF
jgi:hypothetical protein